MLLEVIKGGLTVPVIKRTKAKMRDDNFGIVTLILYIVDPAGTYRHMLMTKYIYFAN
jgi:hypothetical protein